jgi:hypothetical protein
LFSRENAGLRRDAIGSQVIDALEAQEIKETGILIPSDSVTLELVSTDPDLWAGQHACTDIAGQHAKLRLSVPACAMNEPYPGFTFQHGCP